MTKRIVALVAIIIFASFALAQTTGTQTKYHVGDASIGGWYDFGTDPKINSLYQVVGHLWPEILDHPNNAQLREKLHGRERLGVINGKTSYLVTRDERLYVPAGYRTYAETRPESEELPVTHEATSQVVGFNIWQPSTWAVGDSRVGWLLVLGFVLGLIGYLSIRHLCFLVGRLVVTNCHLEEQIQLLQEQVSAIKPTQNIIHLGLADGRVSTGEIEVVGLDIDPNRFVVDADKL